MILERTGDLEIGISNQPANMQAFQTSESWLPTEPLNFSAFFNDFEKQQANVFPTSV